MGEQSIWIINTRAADQAGKLNKLISQCGWQAVPFPVIKIDPPDGEAEFKQVLSRLNDFQYAVFVSANAVNSVVHSLDRFGFKLPESLKIAAIGPGTAFALEQSGISVSYLPEGRFNSEGLIDVLRSESWRQQKVVLFRGQSGRELIQDTLQKWGAQVLAVESYTRQLYVNGLNLDAGKADFVVIPSVAVLDFLEGNLKTMPENQTVIAESTAIAYSSRIAEECHTRKIFAAVKTAAESTDSGAIKCIQTVLETGHD